MQVEPRFTPVTPYSTPIVTEAQAASQRGLEQMFPQDQQESEDKRGKLAAVGCLGSLAVSTVSTTALLVVPEVFVTTTAGITGSAPTLSTVDCARGQPINTSLKQLMGTVKETYLEGYTNLKKAL